MRESDSEYFIETEGISPRCGDERVLVIEDEEAIRSLAMRVLSQAGYRVTTAEDGLKAWKIFESNAGAFDLLFVDAQMPNLDGEGFVRRAHTLNPGVPILFTSGYLSDHLQSMLTREPQFFFLAKPSSPEAMLVTVRSILDKRQMEKSE